MDHLEVDRSHMKSNTTILITTVPFGATDRTPLDLMAADGATPKINPIAALSERFPTLKASESVACYRPGNLLRGLEKLSLVV